MKLAELINEIDIIKKRDKKENWKNHSNSRRNYICLLIWFILNSAPEEHLGIPKTYSDCFKILQERKIISKQLDQKLLNIARFRNLLIHFYWNVNDEKIYEILQAGLNDFNEFAD